MFIFSLLPPNIFFKKSKLYNFCGAKSYKIEFSKEKKKYSELQLIVKHLDFNLNHMPKIRSARMMNQVIISTVGYTENRTLTKKLLLRCPLHFFLPPKFHYLPM